MTRAALIGAATAAALLVAPAQAQDADLQMLQDRLLRLDRDLSGLQAQVYRGGAGGAAALARPPGSPGAPPSVDGPATGVSGRIRQLEGELRGTNAQIDEINRGVAQIKLRLDKLVTDLDARLTALEKSFAERPPAAQAAAAGKPGAAPPAKPGAPPAKAEPAVAVKLPNGTPKEQYDYAFDLLKRSNYPAAEQALKQFVTAHPKDALAGNAQYWLAETYFVRNNFGDAAQQFLAGYQKYPQGPKAPDNLYKLGLSLAKLNKTPEACAAFARFQKEYPEAGGGLKGRVADERTRLKCS